MEKISQQKYFKDSMRIPLEYIIKVKKKTLYQSMIMCNHM